MNPITQSEQAESAAPQAADQKLTEALTLEQRGERSYEQRHAEKQLRLEYYAARENTAQLKAAAEKELARNQADAVEADRQTALAQQREERFKIEARANWIKQGRGTMTQFEQAFPAILEEWKNQQITQTASGAGNASFNLARAKF